MIRRRRRRRGGIAGKRWREEWRLATGGVTCQRHVWEVRKNEQTGRVWVYCRGCCGFKEITKPQVRGSFPE